jgi:hypothetical protein
LVAVAEAETIMFQNYTAIKLIFVSLGERGPDLNIENS